MKYFKKFRRWLINLLLLGFIAGILFIITGLIITRYYGDELKEYSIKQINEQLEIKVSVEEIDFSLFAKFPYISVVFNDVTAWSGHTINISEFHNTNADTLFSSEKIFLQFNIFDLLFNNFHIRRILAVNGNLNLLTDSQGKVNFRIFRNKNVHKTSGKNLVYELEAVKLSNFNIKIINIAKQLKTEAYLKDILLKGKFRHKEFSLGTIGSLKLHDLSREGIRYAKDFEVSTKLIMSVKDTTAEITKGEITINNLKMSTHGKLFLGQNKEIDIEAHGRNFDLHSLYNSLPIAEKKDIDLDIYGRGDLAVKVSGLISRLNVPSIRAVYIMNINKIKYADKVFQNIDLKGKYSNGALKNAVSSSIKIEKFLFRDYESDLTGSIQIENLKEPYIKLRINGKTNASILNKLVNNNKISDFSGIFLPDFQLQTKLGSLKELSLNSFLASGLSGIINFENLSVTRTDNYSIEDLNGNIRFAGESWYPDIEFSNNESNIHAKLQVDHVFKYLSGQTENLLINGDISSDYLDLTPLTRLKSEKQKNSEKEAFKLPDELFARLSLNIKKFKTGKFNSTAMEGYLQYKPGFLSVSELKMNTMEGWITGNSAIMQDEEYNLYIRTQNQLRHININTLFHSFNNFKQDFIVEENVEGFLSGTVDFETAFDSLLNVQKDHIITSADIKITSGELINFEPVMKLSRFVEIEELAHIHFENLENRIIIKDRNVVIPAMDINSSAFNISASGTHSFDKYFNYHVKVNLSELLTKKAKRSRIENAENWTVEEDGRRASLYLLISGTPNDYKVKYDQQRAITTVKEDLKKEKTQLKGILNEEFGFFKKDSSLKQVEPTGSKFIIDWEEEEIDSPEIPSEKKKNRIKEKEKLKFEWDDD